jgi:curli biogenesis system outer membrane secretion channel CsgG
MLLWPSSENTAPLDQTPAQAYRTSLGHEPTRQVHYIVIDKQDNTCYMLGSLPSAHLPTDIV